jgi:S-adenosylmethionine uptake transporter
VAPPVRDGRANFVVTMTSPRSSDIVVGILLYSAGVFFFAVNDALGKWLVADYAVAQLLLLRTVGAFIVLGPILFRTKVPLFSLDQWRLQLLRVVCMAVDTFCFYWATQFLPLADVMTFYMAAPLIITALSGPLLGEVVGPYRWGAVVAGFIGVLIALRPTEAAFSPAAIVAFLGAIMFAIAITVTRKLRQTHWLQLTVWQLTGAGLLGAATSPFNWVTPGLVDLGLLFLLGIVAMSCFVCITQALSRAPASVLAPYQYASILWAALLGWLIWGDTLTPAILIGNCIIVASGLFLFWRERRRGLSVADRVEPIP